MKKPLKISLIIFVMFLIVFGAFYFLSIFLSAPFLSNLKTFKDPSNNNQSSLESKTAFSHSLKVSESKSSFISSNGTIKTPCREVSLSSLQNQKNSFEKEKRISRYKKLQKLSSESIDWVFKDIQDQVIDLYCLRGKKVLFINFWATWCAACIEELPSLSRLAESKKDQIFIVAISDEPLKTITNFLNQSFPDLSPYMKFAQTTEKERSKYFPESIGIPTTYIFDKKGLLKAKETGARDWSKEFPLIQSILKI